MPGKLEPKAAIWAGLMAGAVFVLFEMLLVATVGGDSPWAPPRMMAAIALGRDVLPPPATFDLGIMGAGMAVHFALSILYAFILGWAISRWRLGLSVSILVGIVFGLAIYAVNFYLFTDLFPWFAMARNWMTILAHAVFGAVLGSVYRTAASVGPSARTGEEIAR